ncbi:MAG: DUF6273 domain-containing protein [Oscillospiraceae bacterium]|nr:DUF6273 domain-containing protein [Oscillospiraceae bacterium]
MGIYSGVTDKAHRVHAAYIGVGGRARKVKVVYAGVDGKARLIWPAFTVDPVFANNSWTTIGKAVEHDLVPESWKIGDLKPLTLTTGEVITMQIYGIDHDDLAAGGKARFTLGMRSVLPELRQTNPVRGGEGTHTDSAIYAWLTGAFWETLPGDFKAILKPVIKRTGAGGMSTELLEQALTLFLFSGAEIAGGAPAINIDGEGHQYPVFTSVLATRIKTAEGTATPNRNWWTRSPRAANLGQFSVIITAGALSADNPDSFPSSSQPGRFLPTTQTALAASALVVVSDEH